MGLSWKGFLKDYDIRKMVVDIRFQVVKFVMSGDTADVPRNYVEHVVSVDSYGCRESSGTKRVRTCQGWEGSGIISAGWRPLNPASR